MSKVDIAYVILHYMTLEDTIQLVNSIISKRKNENIQIVVVDNGSSNNSGAELERIFHENSIVTVLLNKENVGFARGNNIGFKYVKEELKPEFIVLMNNDLLMIQEDFYTSVKKEYELNGFGLLGPLVFTADGRWDSSPVRNAPITYEKIITNHRKEKLYYLVESMHLYGLINAWIKVKSLFAKKIKITKYNLERVEDVVLHGCCLVFSKKYYQEMDGLNESTFLYHEEEILYLETKARKQKIVFCPGVQIFHKEDSASDAIMPKGHEKRLFKYKNCLQSSAILISVFEGIDENGKL